MNKFNGNPKMLVWAAKRAFALCPGKEAIRNLKLMVLANSPGNTLTFNQAWRLCELADLPIEALYMNRVPRTLRLPSVYCRVHDCSASNRLQKDED